ncbi:hypothetical protein MIMGU_mgv1a026545mg [Erythranthe guttata]|uniref:Peptidase A1 domain-containing protein n=1 Tax=Erythranthe guttata TaxID=4155 RepID=A0A022S399_ERYGU|nr:PREDICTED: aspartic proteinase CDR1-like [Erythranthe guttata]EYU46726.1 hypothetical protein MIMGU_mgv1a026545mg [Erythranthe guttata]|eukprot:XP_012836291.1 PREDICTED: aspartic proteinase CDR1-like [Erythranthe guttata]
MAKAQTLLLLCFLSTLIFTLNKATIVNSNGLTVKLIHPHSPESPSFQGNLSSEERIKTSVFQSYIRGNYLARTSSSTMQTQIKTQLFHYTVKVGIGTFKSKPSYKEYYLEMDTGGGLVWMQCDGCTKCFKQTPKPFPKQNSSSYRPILVENKPSFYECAYQDGDSTSGMSAQETFYLTSKNGGLAKIENLKFGCGLVNNMHFGEQKNNKIAGIMGLGWEEISFVKQLGPQIKGVFSYCLPVVSDKTPSTYLRFGEDVSHIEKYSKSTPLYRKNKDNSYYVDLQGISVNKTRLDISPQVFALRNDVRSGCMIDSGMPYSRIVSPAFDLLKMKLEKYFSGFKGLKKIKGDLGLELCYERSKAEKYNNLPEVTLHFRGADFVMKAEAVFEVVGRSIIRLREYFCLGMVRDSRKSIIGSHQQTNHRIVYDTKNKRLVFYPVDCSKNP